LHSDAIRLCNADCNEAGVTGFTTQGADLKISSIQRTNISAL
jgi:hypothetical protein